MTRIAILGGGISGLTAAFELELARRRGAAIDWHLYEASDRLGGVVETTRHTTSEGTFILEGGPDASVSEKPWARELAIELGLEADLIYSNDATRRTYIWQQNSNVGEAAGKLQPIPDRMRLMVPEDLSALDGSPLFSDSARAAYAAELANAEQLKRAAQLREAAPEPDESVATFVLRHFGPEVLEKLAAPLLSGVFGGDVHKLSARAVMPAFVAMERDHGSLIAGLQAKSRERGDKPTQPIFTSLRRGMGSLVDAIVGSLPTDRLQLQATIVDIGDENRRNVIVDEDGSLIADRFDHVILATSLDATHNLLRLDEDHRLQQRLPTEASSAVLATFCWPAELARTFTLPPGFGFLVPQDQIASPKKNCHPEHTGAPGGRSLPVGVDSEGPALGMEQHTPRLLACTFVDQKFPHRAPPGARILRAFFGGPAAESLTTQSDDAIAAAALAQLRTILGPLPEPDPALTTVRRWPRSLPQYEVGHLDRMAQLDELVDRVPGLTLLGNSYRGVGLPDLIYAARQAARHIAAE